MKKAHISLLLALLFLGMVEPAIAATRCKINAEELSLLLQHDCLLGKTCNGIQASVLGLVGKLHEALAAKNLKDPGTLESITAALEKNASFRACPEKALYLEKVKNREAVTPLLQQALQADAQLVRDHFQKILQEDATREPELLPSVSAYKKWWESAQGISRNNQIIDTFQRKMVNGEDRFVHEQGNLITKNIAPSLPRALVQALHFTRDALILELKVDRSSKMTSAESQLALPFDIQLTRSDDPTSESIVNQLQECLAKGNLGLTWKSDFSGDAIYEDYRLTERAGEFLATCQIVNEGSYVLLESAAAQSVQDFTKKVLSLFKLPTDYDIVHLVSVTLIAKEKFDSAVNALGIQTKGIDPRQVIQSLLDQMMIIDMEAMTYIREKEYKIESINKNQLRKIIEKRFLAESQALKVIRLSEKLAPRANWQAALWGVRDTQRVDVLGMNAPSDKDYQAVGLVRRISQDLDKYKWNRIRDLLPFGLNSSEVARQHEAMKEAFDYEAWSKIEGDSEEYSSL